jgi:hypothetical protein
VSLLYFSSSSTVSGGAKTKTTRVLIDGACARAACASMAKLRKMAPLENGISGLWWVACTDKYVYDGHSIQSLLISILTDRSNIPGRLGRPWVVAREDFLLPINKVRLEHCRS